MFVLEEESDASRFSIHRLVSYCAALSEMCQTDRVVPVVVFLRRADNVRRTLRLGSEHTAYLRFTYIGCTIADLPGRQYLDSPNLVARLNLPNMAHCPEENEKMLGLTERLRDEGRIEGRKEGRMEGQQAGERDFLLRLPEQRFGPLDERIRARVLAASLDEIHGWAGRLLDAGTLDEVFRMS